MKKINILYISGSLGLGHVTRDLAIARQLRKIIPGAGIEWLAAHPATLFLEEAGEKLVPETQQYADENRAAEQAAKGANLNLLRYLLKARDDWGQNVNVFRKIVTSKQYDLVIGDETYEINLALRKYPELKRFHFVIIYDIVGLEPMTRNPLEHLGVYYWNRVWSHDYRLKRKPPYDLGLFVGMEKDIPDISFGFGLPGRREFARAMYTFIGYVFPFDPVDYANKKEVRKKLGYDDRPLVIASIGGTAIGRELLELCGEAYTLAKTQIPDLRMVLVTGPRLSAVSLRVPKEVEVREFIPKLYEHFAACDLTIVQGGATSTLELTALRRPFIYFPIEGHSEQASVARMLAQHGAGVRMELAKTTPASLAEKIFAHLGKEVNYPVIPADGAEKAAQLIAGLLRTN
jgi:UDP:flavonoid glycosyltransferase YjiC (YdhE family)